MTRSPGRHGVDPIRARQGRLSYNMLWVLTIALALVVLGFLAAWAWHAQDLANAPNQGRAPASAARTFNAPQSSAATRQNYQTGGALAPQNHGNPGQPDQSKTAEP
jgi:hypothetical protein